MGWTCVNCMAQNYSAWNDDDSSLQTYSSTVVLPSPSTILASVGLTGFWNYFTDQGEALVFISQYTKEGVAFPITFPSPGDNSIGTFVMRDSNVESVTYAITVSGTFAYGLLTILFWEYS